MALLLAATEDDPWQKGLATFVLVLIVVGLVAGGYAVKRWFEQRRDR